MCTDCPVSPDPDYGGTTLKIYSIHSSFWILAGRGSVRRPPRGREGQMGRASGTCDTALVLWFTTPLTVGSWPPRSARRRCRLFSDPASRMRRFDQLSPIGAFEVVNSSTSSSSPSCPSGGRTSDRAANADPSEGTLTTGRSASYSTPTILSSQKRFIGVPRTGDDNPLG